MYSRGQRRGKREHFDFDEARFDGLGPRNEVFAVRVEGLVQARARLIQIK